MTNLLNTDYGKGIYPAYSNRWERITAGYNLTTDIIDNNLTLTATGANSYVFLTDTLPAGDYTFYGLATLVNPVGGIDNTIKFRAGSTYYYSEAITQEDQPIELNVTVEADGDFRVYCGNVFYSGGIVSIKNLNIVHKSFPNVQEWSGSNAEYLLHHNEESFSFRFDKVVSNNVDQDLVRFICDTGYKMAIRTTTSNNRLNFFIKGTTAGDVSILFAPTEFITITIDNTRVCKVYKNKLLVGAYSLTWDLYRLYKVQLNPFVTTNCGADIAYMVFDKDANTGFNIASDLTAPTRRYIDDEFEDLTYTSDTAVALIEARDDVHQQICKLSTPTFKDFIIGGKLVGETFFKAKNIPNDFPIQNHDLMADRDVFKSMMFSRPWNQLTVPNGYLRSVCYAENLQRFVAVGQVSSNNIQYSDDASSNNIQYSDDGITWNQLTVPTGALRSVCYAENLQRFVAVGAGSSNNIQYSDDGITWNQITVPDGRLQSVCYADNLQRYVAVGYGSVNNIQYSDDGITWNQLTVPDGNLYGVCYAENIHRFVAVGQASSNNTQYSDDGINWIQVNTPDGSLYSVCYSENLQRFVAVGDAVYNNIQYSDNGVHWTQITVPNGSLTGVCYAENLTKFAAVGLASSNNIQTIGM